jgi:hypothetical protein
MESDLVLLDAASPLFTYDPRLRRHRYKSNGRMVSLKDVEAQTRKLIDFKTAELQTLGRFMLDGKIDLPSWQKATAETLKTIHLQVLLIERGGIHNTTVEDNLAVGRNLKSEYAHLRKFADQIYRGEVTKNQFFARLKKYVDNAQVVKQIVKRQQAVMEDLKAWAKRSLGPNDKHCPDCPAYEGIWPANQVVMPGERCVCGGDCKCSVEFLDADPRL